MAGGCRWLLVGNSRWHWAEARSGGLDCWHGPAPGPGWAADAELAAVVGWAAVGSVPPRLADHSARRLVLGDVPLGGTPPWLGIDRALAGWRAAADSPGATVLVADAGTVLSLTRVDRRGRFRGGRLLAGLQLQLAAMAAGTALLPALQAVIEPPEPWPSATDAAMVSGVAHGLAAAVAAAVRQAAEPGEPCCLWLTGGDGALLQPLLAPSLAAAGWALRHDPDLVMRAMASLRPGPAA
ncbi:MAG: type III pantothenate kinase [Cyanobacteriota bacterium]|jgi:type III pantothenate kinase|nr:type III pantothenate kinase [Cyanobacteriota bacterium]